MESFALKLQGSYLIDHCKRRTVAYANVLEETQKTAGALREARDGFKAADDETLAANATDRIGRRQAQVDVIRARIAEFEFMSRNLDRDVNYSLTIEDLKALELFGVAGTYVSGIAIPVE